MKDLEGKVAIVTGGATLIGAGVVRALRGYGVRVAVLDVDGAGGEKVAAADPQGCRARQVDITDDARLEQCVAEAARHFGRLDFLVNLAATYLDDGAASGRADWLRALDINLVSAVMAARRAPTWYPAAAPSSTSPASRPRPRRRAAGSIRCPRPRWCSSHATWRWTSPATASASIRCRQAGPGRA